MSRPLVTIAISTYNRADGYLREALESALAQTWADLEVVVSDNASTDGTRAYLEGIADPRLRVVRQPENLGANGNFNACLEAARGEWFLLLHDDDRLDPDMVEACLREPVPDDVVLIRTGVRVIDEAGRSRSEKPNRAPRTGSADFFLSYFAGRTNIYFCNTLFRTSVLREVGGFHSPHDLLEDGVAIARMLSRGGRREVPDVKAAFRRHGSNRGGTVRIREWCEDSSYLLDLMVRASGDRAEEVRQQGRAFFSRQNYNRLQRNGSWAPSAYWQVYEHFGRAYPPLRYLFARNVTRRLKRRLHALGFSAS